MSGNTGKRKHQSNNKNKNKKRHRQRAGQLDSFSVHYVGVLVTCGALNESKSRRELIKILEEEYYSIVGSGNGSGGGGDTEEKAKKSDAVSTTSTTTTDFSSTLANELEEMKKDSNTSVKLSDRLFQALRTGCSGVLFIRFNFPSDTVIEPQTFVANIIRKLKEKRQTRYTFKFYPIQKIVHSNMEEILAGLKPFVDKAFQQGEFKPKDETEIKPIKFRLLWKSRQCETVPKSSSEAAQSIAALVSEKHCVDLEKPDVVILAQSLRRHTLLAVLPDFQELDEYNIGAKDAAEQQASVESAKEPEEKPSESTDTDSKQKQQSKEDKPTGFRLL